MAYYSIETVSSESDEYPAANLVKGLPWLCGATGLKDASVEVKLTNPCQIDKISVKNNYSGLLEVLGRVAGDDDKASWVSIVPKSSLMTPGDARNGLNGDAERDFHLKAEYSDVLFEALKFVCQQPFNKDIPFGLQKIEVIPKLGADNTVHDAGKASGFVLKKKEKSDGIKPGDLFKKKEGGTPSPAPGSLHPSSGTSSDRNNETGEETEPKPSTSKRRSSDDASNDEAKVTKGKKKSPKQPAKRKKKSEEEDDEDAEESTSRKKTRRGAKTESLQDIMRGVVFALSGFVNPERGELRQKACDMGAKYKADWTSDCTHLICAFANTPKFNQVRTAGGKILKKEWINDSYANKRMMPWRNYLLKPARTAAPDDEDEDEMEEAKFNEDEEWKPDADSDDDDEVEEEEEDEEEVMSDEFEEDEEDDEENGSDLDEEDEDEEQYADKPKGKKGPTGRVQKKPVAKKNTNGKRPTKSKKRGARFDSDSEDSEELHLTDSEEPDVEEKDVAPRQIALLRGKYFYLHGNFSLDEDQKLRKLIEKLSGSVREYNDEKVTHCVTNNEWDEEFDDALVDNPNLVFVTPQWVYDCEKQRALPDPKKYTPRRGQQ